jgi:hypothetical protein
MQEVEIQRIFATVNITITCVEGYQKIKSNSSSRINPSCYMSAVEIHMREATESNRECNEKAREKDYDE